MVLAAGLGTRMRPHNGQIPKPLVTVAGKALIDYMLDRLADTGVERAVVNVHYLADQIEQHLAPRQRPRIALSDERAKLLGPAGCAGCGWKACGCMSARPRRSKRRKKRSSPARCEPRRRPHAGAR